MKIIVIGGGFAGLFAARNLGARKDLRKKGNLEITLIDKRNFHLFQPLLYQVATGGLSPGDIAAPLRAILKEYPNVRVVQGTVNDLDPADRTVSLEDGRRLDYDYLLVATGVTHDYFGNGEWERYSPGLKTVEDSLEMRRKILSSFEHAENEAMVHNWSAGNKATAGQDASAAPPSVKESLTFVIVGGGPTGVELAGAIGELASKTLSGEFRNISLDDVNTIILEGGSRLLSSFPEKLSEKAKLQLEDLGVEVRLNCYATSIDERGVSYSQADKSHRIDARTVLWAAGVRVSALGGIICEKTGAPRDRAGRVEVLPDLSIEGYPELMIAGDLAALTDASGKKVPGVAPAAMQQGAYVANRIASMLKGEKPKPFKYRDKGSLAVIGRNAAVAAVGPFKLSGFVAWLLWALVHIYFLIDFGNKLVVAIQWIWSYLTKKRGARLITSGFGTAFRKPSPAPAGEG